MADHTIVFAFVHFMWPTKLLAPVLEMPVAAALEQFLSGYGESKNIRVITARVQPDHVHLVASVPANMPVETGAKLFKGAASHWLNRKRLLAGKFSWDRGYGAFSVSASALPHLVAHLENQEEYHRTRDYYYELTALAHAYANALLPKPFKTVSPSANN